jgi:hypothetical protein
MPFGPLVTRRPLRLFELDDQSWFAFSLFLLGAGEVSTFCAGKGGGGVPFTKTYRRKTKIDGLSFPFLLLYFISARKGEEIPLFLYEYLYQLSAEE